QVEQLDCGMFMTVSRFAPERPAFIILAASRRIPERQTGFSARCFQIPLGAIQWFPCPVMPSRVRTEIPTDVRTGGIRAWEMTRGTAGVTRGTDA
ncbi:hypothetical protein K7G98_39210, partial [Saccharothrix sp. MB29]|nr:hypothetical protein [Saccharothrix sp. MB29]